MKIMNEQTGILTKLLLNNYVYPLSLYTGNDYSGLTGRQIYNKSDQWLGAAMSSGGPNGSLVVRNIALFVS